MMSEAETSLSSRPPGYSVILECLANQQRATPRSRLGRVLGFRPVHPEYSSWFIGALGEMRVGRLLAKLGQEWLVLHSVPVGDESRDIDHVAIGPAGVFTINTKHHRGADVWVSPKSLLVSGQKYNHLLASRFEARDASDRFKRALGVDIPVHPLLVVVGARKLTIKQKPDDVTVLTELQLLRWLKRQKTVLDEAAVAQVKQLASSVRFWHSTSDGAVDLDHMVTFAALRQEDNQARRRRIAWASLLAAGLGAVLVFFGPALTAALVQGITGF